MRRKEGGRDSEASWLRTGPQQCGEQSRAEFLNLSTTGPGAGQWSCALQDSGAPWSLPLSHLWSSTPTPAVRTPTLLLTMSEHGLRMCAYSPWILKLCLGQLG